MTDLAVTESKLPTTLGWYRDAANWVVGLSAGALAAAITQIDRVRGAGRGPEAIFVVAAILFLIALVSGIQFYLWLTSYGNARERSDAPRMEKAERRFGFFHDLMIWTFHLGIIGLAVVALWLLFAEPKSAREWSVAGVSCDGPVRDAGRRPSTPDVARDGGRHDSLAFCDNGRPLVLKIEKYTGEARLLVADSAGHIYWTPVPEDTVARGSTR